jgi:hypothetical protein
MCARSGYDCRTVMMSIVKPRSKTLPRAAGAYWWEPPVRGDSVGYYSYEALCMANARCRCRGCYWGLAPGTVCLVAATCPKDHAWSPAARERGYAWCDGFAGATQGIEHLLREAIRVAGIVGAEGGTSRTKALRTSYTAPLTHPKRAASPSHG